MKLVFGGGGDAEDERPLLSIFAQWVGAGRLLYVPFASDPPHDQHLAWVKAALAPLGVRNIALALSVEDVLTELPLSDAVFIGGGNTYSLLHALRAANGDTALRRFAKSDRALYGGSAGAILLGRDIGTARHADPNDVGLSDTHGLDLALGYAIWCHYNESDTSRIRAYITETGQTVVALDERSGLVRVEQDVRVVGYDPATLFDPEGDRILNVGDLLPALESDESR